MPILNSLSGHGLQTYLEPLTELIKENKVQALTLEQATEVHSKLKSFAKEYLRNDTVTVSDSPYIIDSVESREQFNSFPETLIFYRLVDALARYLKNPDSGCDAINDLFQDFKKKLAESQNVRYSPNVQGLWAASLPTKQNEIAALAELEGLFTTHKLIPSQQQEKILV